MDQFSIAQLARFSGIKPHTIRIWEQRYGALQPHRSAGNTRYYDSQQLRRLLNITSLLEAGYKASELGALPDKKLFRMVNELLDQQAGINNKTEYYVTQLIKAGMSYDEPWFEKIFNHCLLRFGMEDTYRNILYPMLVRIGQLWLYDALPPAQEHFISNLIRQKIYVAIDGLPAPKESSDMWLLFLPEDEFHDIGLLVANYLIRLSGRKTVYLGSNVPQSSLVNAVKELSPNNLLLFLVHQELPEEVQQYITGLSKHFSAKKIYVAGSERLTESLPNVKNVHLLTSIEDLEQQLL
jgi:DNA-binding transcriptional MerR regulator